MKLAICLFGNVGIPSSASQRKNVDLINESSSASTSPKVAFEGFKKNFLENYKTDLFIHSWSENYKDLLCKFYKPKNFLFEPQKIFKPKLEDYGINNSNNISDWNISNDTKLSYSLLKDGLDKDSDLKSLLLETAFRGQSRWYSSNRSVQLMKEYSTKNQVNYDFVLVSRIDCLFENHEDLNNLNSNNFYASKRHGREDIDIALHDFFFLSSQENIENFSSKIYENIYQYSIQQMTASRQVASELFGEDKIIHYLEYQKDYDKVRSYENSRFENLKNKIPFFKNV
tara:strand:- start:12928 stop:13782 length:855 start_codon:yes stop_codon:yes gene_type:complete